MTFPAIPFRAAIRRPTYARARLLLGITGVGTAVLAAITILWSDVVETLLSTSADQPLVAALGTLAIFFVASQLAFMLFDMVGGALLVRRRDGPSAWFQRWLRGAATQWCVWMISAGVLLVTARWTTAHTSTALGLYASGGVFVVLQLMLAMLRGTLTRVVAAMPSEAVPDSMRVAAERAGIDVQRLLVVEAIDEGFVGGHTGLGADRLIVPRRWMTLPTRALTAALVRRHVTAVRGAHLRGVLGALVWNTAGFALVLWLSDARLATAAGIVTMTAGMTLWAFVGVLLLPTPSRAAVFAIDRDAAQRAGVADVAQSIELLDRWQDDEPARSRLVETIFHPVPSRATRLARLSAAGGGVRWYHTHHIARHALWLSWAGCTPLSRLVHCNVGRPALWVMLPGD
jgi:hypothetical protein